VNAPHIPTQLDQLGSRPFSFYPSIVGVEHNQWRLRRVTWTEVHVINTKTDLEMWVPRHLVGEVSLIEEPVRIVGLIKELEYKGGVLIPHRRRVLEMPRAVGDSPRPGVIRENLFRPILAENTARVVGIRVEEGSRARRWRRILGWIATGLLACIAAALALVTIGGHRRGVRAVDPFGHRVHR
jgi:hypothetical protein